MANRTPVRGPARVVFRQSREHYRFDPPNLLLTTLKVAAAIAVVSVAVRSTTFTDYNAPKQPTVFQPPNTLLTLLAPPAAVVAPQAAAPFRQQDWPNPAKPWQRDLTWFDTPQAIPPVVIPPIIVPAPFAQEDWPNPARPWQRDLTWTQSPKVQQIVPGAAVAEGQRAHGFTDYFAKPQPFAFDPPNTLALLARPVVAPAVAVAPPFNQEDWPNPRGSPVRDLTWTNTPEVIPQVADIAVANRIPNQTDWPNPLRTAARDLTWTQSPAVPPAVAAPVVVVPTPFAQEDWPNPILRSVRIKTTPQSFRPAFDTTVTTAAAASTTFPFDQTNWPNPVLRIPFRESGWIRFANIDDIPAQPTPPPPADAVADGGRSHGFTDFNAPKYPPQFDPPNTLLGGIPTRPTPPPVVLAPPFSQEDWPNPVVRTVRIKTPQSARPAFDLVVTTVASTTFPFSQEDWPNPVRRIAQREFGFTRFANVGDIPQRFIAPAPFDQTDWPNPLTPWRRDLTWLQSPQVQQIVPEPASSTFPFSLTDQPNPVLRTPFLESGWVRFANIGDIPAAAPPVPVPPAPTDEEVKPSGGRVRHEPVHHHAGTVDPEFRYAIEGRKTYAQKLHDLHIAQQAAEVIEQVALQQAATLEVDEAKNARELKRALRLAKLEDDARYLELLAERRELAKTEEIGALLYKAVRDEEDILALLMIAAQLL